MLQDPKIKKIFIFSYILFLFASFFYVRGIVDDKSVDIGEKIEEKEDTEVKETNVRLIVQNGSQIQEYKYKGKDVDSIIDMFETLRNDEGFRYQIIEYTYGVEFESINGIKPTPPEKWHLYEGQKEITNQVQEIRLEDSKVYTLTRNATLQ